MVRSERWIARPGWTGAIKKFGRWTALASLAALLAGCKMSVLFPSGDIAMRQRDVILVSTFMMLLIIVPVILLTIVFAWWYRASNIDAKYDPDWHHSTQLEVVIWAAPLMIIFGLGAVTWLGTHLLDPFRPLTHIEALTPVPEGTKPLNVEVVALDWKWLFVYPDQGIAVVNEMAAPVNVPISFKITSSSVFNAFSVPALAGMVYAMPGMRSELHAVINEPGEFNGLSANYSGAGFSGMHFTFHGLSGEDFGKWVAQVKSGGTGTLDRATYLHLEQPSEREPVRYFASVDPRLFNLIVNMCVDPSKPCVRDIMHKDAERRALTHYALLGRNPALDKRAICTAADASGTRSALASRRAQAAD